MADPLTKCDKLQQCALVFDYYREPLNLLLPDNQRSYRTFLGSVMSLITFMILTFYAAYKITELVDHTDFQLQVASSENHFKPYDAFSSEHGFVIGAAVTSYDQNPESIEDEEIGTVKFYMKTWNVAKNEGLNFRELVLGPCPMRGFFYRTNENSQGDFSHYGRKMKCIADDSFFIAGNYNTFEASQLMIVFERCDPDQRVCKSDVEID